MSRTSRLRSNSRAISSRRARASSARARAVDDSWLATTLTTRNAKSAIQFCGSAMVNVPTGGRKKKLNVSIATIETQMAIHSRDVAATINTTNNSASATVVGLISSWLMALRPLVVTPQARHCGAPLVLHLVLVAVERRNHDVAMVDFGPERVDGIRPEAVDAIDVFRREMRRVRAEQEPADASSGGVNHELRGQSAIVRRAIPRLAHEVGLHFMRDVRRLADDDLARLEPHG